MLVVSLHLLLMVAVWLVFSLWVLVLALSGVFVCLVFVPFLCWVCLALHGPNLGFCVLHGSNLGGLCIWCCDLLRWVSLSGVLC